MNVGLHKLLSKVFCEDCQLVHFSDCYYKVKFISEQAFEFVKDCAKLLQTVSLDTYPQYSNDDHPYLLLNKTSFETEPIKKKLSVLFNLSELPLHLAAMRGCVYLFKKHLQAGSNVNQLNLFYETPLHTAVRGGHIEIVLLLLEQGADVNSRTINNETAVRIAISTQDFIILQKLLAVPGIEFNSKDNEGNTYLHLAAQVSNEVILSQLIEAGISIESRNKCGETPLISAVYANNQPAINFLLEKGANIDNQDNDGATALHIALSQRNYPMLKILFANGVNVNIKTNQNETALPIATKILKEMIAVENGDGLNSDKENKSALKMLRFFKAANLRYVSVDLKEENNSSLKFGMS